MNDPWDKRLLGINDDAFESLCFSLVLAQGYIDAKRVGGPGDRGRDIQAKYLRTEPDGISVNLENCHFECKRLSKNLGTDELFAKIKWAETNKVDVLVLMCNTRLTSEANEYIEKHNLDKKAPRILDWTGDRFKLVLFNSSSVFSQFFPGERIPSHYLSRIQNENNKKINALIPKAEIEVSVGELLDDEKREAFELRLKQIPQPVNQISTVYGIIGTMLLLHKEYEKSIEYFKKCNSLNSKNITSMVNHAYALLKINKSGKAEEILEKILKLDPNNLYALNGVGHILTERGKYKPAIYRFNQVIKLNPDFTVSSDNKAIALFKLGKIIESIDLLNETLSKKKNVYTLKTKGSLLGKLYAFDAALIVSTEAEKEFKNFELLNQKGHILERMSQIREARGAFEEALKFDPKNSMGISNLAICMHTLGEKQKALSLVEKAIKTEPYNAFGWKTKALILLREGDLELAKECNTEAKKHLRNSEEKKMLHLQEAEIAYKGGNTKKSLKEICMALRIDNRYLEAINFLVKMFPNEQSGPLKKQDAESFFGNITQELGDKLVYVGNGNPPAHTGIAEMGHSVVAGNCTS